MYKLCKTEQSALRQRKLEEGLLEMMQSVQYDEISISDLCQQMDIPRKSFYRYFASKEGALHGLIDHTLMEFEGENESYQAKGSRSLQRELEKFFLFWVRRKSFLDAITKNGLYDILVERTIRYALGATVFPGRFLPKESRQMQNYVVTFAICGLMTIMIQWHSTGYSCSVQEMAKVASRLLTKPLFPEAEKFL